MTNEYTPTTEEVRDGFATEQLAAWRDGRLLAEFDRWLAAHDAGVRATALEEAAQIAEAYQREAAKSAEKDKDAGAYRLSDLAFGRSVGAERVAAAIRAVQENPGKDN